MAFSHVFILSSNCDVLVSKSYRNDVTFNAVDEFTTRAMNTELSSLEPVQNLAYGTLFHIVRGSLFFLLVSIEDVCPVYAIETISRIYEICRDFCGSVTEESIILNYILIQELLDQIMDLGYVQSLDTEKLRSCVLSDPIMPRSPQPRVPGLFGAERQPGSAKDQPAVRPSTTNQGERKNEIFVDVIERISVLYDKEGVLRRCEVTGRIDMKCLLVSGSALVLSMNDAVTFQPAQDNINAYGDRVYLESPRFHPAIGHADFEMTKRLTVKPPTGQFTALTYSVSGQLALGCPFKVKAYCKVNSNKTDLDFGLKLVCDVPASAQALRISVKVPLPSNATGISQRLGGQGQGQSAEFDRQQRALTWQIRQMSAGQTSAHFMVLGGATSDSGPEQMGPVSLDFELSGFLCSGLQLRQLKVQDSALKTSRWVRYITAPDSYIIQLH